MMELDAVVLGAGMVGVSVALHLQQRGWRVALRAETPGIRGVGQRAEPNTTS